MKISAFVVDGHPFDIRPAPVERDWMDATPDRFAYRCLPLNIANAHGWEILCQGGFNAVWNGNSGLDAISIVPDPGTQPPAVSHFGSGVLTFHVPCLFRTDPGYDLMVQGPINRPKHGVAPLSGIVEADWSPFSFTMNWRFTAPSVPVRFDKGEPYCHVFPVRRGALEETEAELHVLSDDAELKRQHEAWSQSRLKFNDDLKVSHSDAQSEKWQRKYYHGLAPDGRELAPEDHRTRLRLSPFRRP